jgi:hypothetical protein
MNDSIIIYAVAKLLLISLLISLCMQLSLAIVSINKANSLAHDQRNAFFRLREGRQ